MSFSHLRKRARTRAAFAFAALVTLGCSRTTAFDEAADAIWTVSARSAEPLTRHVIVISVDGLRADAIAHYRARTLTRLIEEGSASLNARTILPSKTLPSHTSMLTGAEPEVHGVYWNEERMEEHGHVATPTIFATANEAGLETAAFFSKSKFEHLAAPGTIDHASFPRGLGRDLASKTVDAVQAYLGRARPNLLFVHLADADYAGHIFGWMSWPYGRAVEAVDREIAELMRSADRAFGAGNYTLIVTADHGGHDRNHGSDDPRDVTIPWIAWGKGVAPGKTLPDGIRTLDTAATALALLGLSAAPEVAGNPVVAAFPSLPVTAVAAATDEGGV